MHRTQYFYYTNISFFNYTKSPTVSSSSFAVLLNLVSRGLRHVLEDLSHDLVDSISFFLQIFDLQVDSRLGHLVQRFLCVGSSPLHEHRVGSCGS